MTAQAPGALAERRVGIGPDRPEPGVAVHGSASVAAEPDLRRVSFAADLGRYGDRPAVLTEVSSLTYRELAALVATTAARLGPERRLELLAAANDLDSLVAYLAALLPATRSSSFLRTSPAPWSRSWLRTVRTSSFDPGTVVCPTSRNCDRGRLTNCTPSWRCF